MYQIIVMYDLIILHSLVIITSSRYANNMKRDSTFFNMS